MQGPTVSARNEAGKKVAGDASVAQHDQPVADGEQLVEILRNQQHRGAGGARRAEQLAQRLGAARVEAAGRIKRNDQLRIMRQFARQHDAAADFRRTAPPRGVSDGSGGKRSRQRLRSISATSARQSRPSPA